MLPSLKKEAPMNSGRSDDLGKIALETLVCPPLGIADLILREPKPEPTPEERIVEAVKEIAKRDS